MKCKIQKQWHCAPFLKRVWHRGSFRSYGLYQFVTLHFGLFGAPATFQHVIDQACGAMLLTTWMMLSSIVPIVPCLVLQSLRKAGLTSNPKQCAVGWSEVWSLVYHLGGRQVCLQPKKTAATTPGPIPKKKKRVARVLGVIGYYCWLIPSFEVLTSPLSDLTQKTSPVLSQWME